MSHQITFTKPALKDFTNLQKTTIKQIDTALLTLANDPHQPGTKKLKGSDDLFRHRVGDYRIIFQIDSSKQTILVLRIRHRREVYR